MWTLQQSLRTVNEMYVGNVLNLESRPHRLYTFTMPQAKRFIFRPYVLDTDRSLLRCTYAVDFEEAEDGIRDYKVTGVQTCALPI